MPAITAVVEVDQRQLLLADDDVVGQEVGVNQPVVRFVFAQLLQKTLQHDARFQEFPALLRSQCRMIPEASHARLIAKKTLLVPAVTNETRRRTPRL